MFSELISVIVGAICLLLGLIPLTEKITGGSKKLLTEKEVKSLTEKEYSHKVTIAPYDPKWTSGDLVSGYPQCVFVGKSGPVPPGVTWTGPEPRYDLPHCHWGQRKLLLTEIDFLNGIPREQCIVVYAGAADGRHIPILVDLYPHVEFHLYDPRKFYPGLDGHHHIRLNPYYGGATNEKGEQHGWFTDEVAEWYRAEGRCNISGGAPARCGAIYFVSDIRTTPTEEEVERNQRQQEAWIRIMRPRRSMLKFRVPYPHVGAPARYRHIRGRVRMQCWAPIRSAETRLIVDGVPGDAEWDVVEYERNMAWYNQVLRTHDFSGEMLATLGVPAVGTVRDFWRLPGALGWDYVYELKILTAALAAGGDGITVESLRELRKKIDSVLISPGAKFQYYLRE